MWPDGFYYLFNICHIENLPYSKNISQIRFNHLHICRMDPQNIAKDINFFLQIGQFRLIWSHWLSLLSVKKYLFRFPSNLKKQVPQYLYFQKTVFISIICLLLKIMRRDSNSQPLKYKSPPLTTRPGLPPNWSNCYCEERVTGVIRKRHHGWVCARFSLNFHYFTWKQ